MNENSDAIVIVFLMAKSNSKQDENYNLKSLQKKTKTDAKKNKAKHILDWEKTD